MEEDSQADKATVQIETAKKGFNPLIIIGAVALLLIVGYFLYSSRQKAMSAVPAVQGGEESTETSQQTGEVMPAGEIKEFTIDGTNFAFNPSSITVNKGDTVKINFKDDDGIHNLTIDGYDVNTGTLAKGKMTVVQFVADKTGNFEYYCAVDGHREKGMVGTLIVQ